MSAGNMNCAHFEVQFMQVYSLLVHAYSLPPLLYRTPSAMKKWVKADIQTQSSNNTGSANGSLLIDTAILHPTMHDLAFTASNMTQKILLKQAAALKRDS